MTEKHNIKKTASIDGLLVKVNSGLTILEAAKKAGIYIPTLCHLERLEPYGGCRLCAVDVEKMKGFPTACTTPIEPGMEIRTCTPELQKLRREILEFTLSEHPFTCLVCKDKQECTDFMHSTRKVNTITGCNFCTSNGDCELQDLVDYLELKDIKFPITYRGIPPVKDNPFYDLDYNLCVLCGRCVRICNEERNSHVLAFVERGNSTIVGTAFQESQVKAGCEYCGACVDVCPTGSISEKIGKWRGVPDKSVTTTCVMCSVGCKMNVNTRDGQLVQIGPQPGMRTDPPQLCLRAKFLPANLNQHPTRITSPLLKKEGRWIEANWKDAFNYLAVKLSSYRGSQFGLIASGQDTLEDNYSLQKFVRMVMKSNNVDIQESYSQRELPELLHDYYSDHPPVGLEQIERTDTILIMGLDASNSHPLLENRIRKSFRSGKEVIYAAPFQTRTSTFITGEIFYKPGNENLFISELLGALSMNPGQHAGSSTHIPEQVVSTLRNSKNLLIIAGDDLLRNNSSAETLQLLFELQQLELWNRRCHMLFPGLEGGIYGSTLMGVHPDYLPGFHPPSTTKGCSCNEMIQGIQKKELSALMVVGDIPVHPNLAKLDFLVQCNMYNTGLSELADVFLPLSDFLENEGHIHSLGGKIRKVNRCITRPGNVKSIASILSGLAANMGMSGLSSKPFAIYREIRSKIEIPSRRIEDAKKGILYRKKRKLKKPEAYPDGIAPRNGHLTYRGNLLENLVPELKEIYDEGN